jgi:hypothetical protein
LIATINPTLLGFTDYIWDTNLFVLGAVECAAGNLESSRALLSKSRTLAWAQEEQTNKPVVVYYAMQLLYAEYLADPSKQDSKALQNIITVLLFLQVYPTTWQAFRDRARKLQLVIEAEAGSKTFAALKKMSDKKLIETSLKLIPQLLEYESEESD